MSAGHGRDSVHQSVSLSSLAVWNHDLHHQVSLHDVPSQLTLPTVAQLVSGKYRSIAAPDSKPHQQPSSSARHHTATPSVVFIQSVRTSHKVYMEAVKVQANGRHVVATGHKFSMPVSYAGWFDVLAEDGTAVEPLPTVAELVALWPAECIVREDELCAIVCSEAQHDNPPQSGGAGVGVTTRLEQTRTLPHGELLALRDVVDAVVEVPADATLKSAASGTQTKQYLRCVDALGDSVFLDVQQRALLSPVAGPYNISGVHNIQSLLDKFRLPLIVRLVCGAIPSKLKSKAFTPVFRLKNVYEDETAFILPLHGPNGDAHMLSVSTREPLVFVPAVNGDVLRQSAAFAGIERRSAALVRSYMNSIHVLVASPDHDALRRARPCNQLLGRDIQTESNIEDEDEEIRLTYDEIDDIYRYVRDGGEPPAPRPRSAPTAATTEPPHQPTAPGLDWEEPIYEDIEKIRRRKRERASTAAAAETNDYDDSCRTRTSEVAPEVRNLDGDRLMPIGNLRQLIKRFSMFESSSTPPTQAKARHRKPAPAPPPISIYKPPGDVEITMLPPPVRPPGGEDKKMSVFAPPACSEYTTDCATLDIDDDELPTQQVADRTLLNATEAPPCAVTSVRYVSRDVSHGRQQDDVTNLCSRVAVGGVSGASLPAAQDVIYSQTTITRINNSNSSKQRRAVRS